MNIKCGELVEFESKKDAEDYFNFASLSEKTRAAYRVLQCPVCSKFHIVHKDDEVETAKES